MKPSALYLQRKFLSYISDLESADLDSADLDSVDLDSVKPSTLELAKLDVEDLSEVYLHICLLSPALQFLSDQRWLRESRNHGSPDKYLKSSLKSYSQFLQECFQTNLALLEPYQSFLSSLSVKDLKKLQKHTLQLNLLLTDFISSLSRASIKSFLNIFMFSLEEVFFQEEELRQQGNPYARTEGLSFYRAFDGLDQVFGIDYRGDSAMVLDIHNGERLYEGAGPGVQSSYSTLMTAFRESELVAGAKVIDLGSGFGRVGLTLGILRPDIEFIGYEYVAHRVDVANQCSHDLSCGENIQFFIQDLSDRNFKIPAADVYYLFDPFTRETYEYVLEQFIAVSLERPVSIVTKGNARLWLAELGAAQGWDPPQEFDGGNLSIFRSQLKAI